MTDYLIWGLALGELFIFVVLLRLVGSKKRLERELKVLEERLQRSNEDLAGLCSAAVAVDRRLAANDNRLNTIADRVNRPIQAAAPQPHPVQDDPVPAQGYEDVIQKIRRGADIDELVRDCGLTRDEALLLMRLHGGGKR
ncbi:MULTISPECIES: DUF2802 domain-containing protein [Methylomonas]|uniref:DUF2802 domain-containing protein n=1 Tax=Methylomonas TaxID=416 RepID=UPI0007C9534B|nr:MULTISPECIES: DUF2802 domain-containing protein [Methylomonas]ANE54189.1 hypothetical protein AYM39_02605 [Methylomonas sp. DH-1]WNB76498.1 DUF2802 domain-containing protein [Methylomonas koyamae]